VFLLFSLGRLAQARIGTGKTCSGCGDVAETEVPRSLRGAVSGSEGLRATPGAVPGSEGLRAPAGVAEVAVGFDRDGSAFALSFIES
jgi:hypothetical protein